MTCVILSLSDLIIKMESIHCALYYKKILDIEVYKDPSVHLNARLCDVEMS